MKATDLMINDLVQCEGCSTPSVVAGITPGKIHTWWADGTKHAKDEVYFTPIPLTAEILEKNGFKPFGDKRLKPRMYQLECFDSEEHQKLGLVTKIIKGGTYYSSVIEVRTPMSLCSNKFELIHNVHELQHALRFCGLNDLADNFKI